MFKVRDQIHQPTPDTDYCEDALPKCDALSEHGRPPRLPHHPPSNGLAIPLPRGSAKQHPVQPAHKILCFEILAVHGYWLWLALRYRSHGPSLEESAVALYRLPSDASDPGQAIQIATWDGTPGDKILDIHSFADTRTIAVIFENGDIVSVLQEPLPGEEAIEILGTIDAGISAVAWSPDEELVAIATKADTLLLMTRDFDPLTDIALSIEDLKVSNHVDVGWGKKETQFKGRGAAKALRDPTMPEHVDEGSLSVFDDGRVTISWRGDGQYFSMNNILPSEPKRRVIRVFSREGILESVSEPINGLEGALSWKPSGQTIAAIQRQVGGLVEVVFFERNGLRHGEFDLRLTSQEAETSASNISLAWNVDSTVLAVRLNDRVQLWTTGNYHWYLKQEILGSRPDLQWHLENSLQLAIANVGCRVIEQKYEFAVAHGSVQPPHDLGLIAVIDGRRLQITPLRIANVPPPMALDDLELPETAQDVFFDEEGNEITVRHAVKTTKWSCDYASKPFKRATLLSSSEEQLHHSNKLEHETFRLSTNGVLQGEGLRIPGVSSYITTEAHLIFTTSTHLLKFVHLRADGGELRAPADEPEKDERCRSVERGARIVTVMPSTFALVLQMPRGNLETIYPRALVLAGIRQSISQRDYKRAFKICRTHRVDMNILHDYAPERFIEDVDQFITQVKKVEYIDLFLSSLSEENVAETIYKETLNARMDGPLTNVHVDGHEQPDMHVQGRPSKVNRICDVFLAALSELPNASLQNIVSAHVCKSPPDLEAGLALVSDLRKQGKQQDLESAVEHICFLSDVNQLYDTALGIYDLDVALLIAQQSQKDPREYLPYLQALNDMPQLRKQYTIDNDLKRHRKALSHLHALGAFEEFKQYMARHNLYSAAIEQYRYDNAKLTELMRLYADHLNSRNRYKEAGIAQEFVGDYASAYEIYRSASLWQEALAAAALAQISDEDVRALAQDLADSLEEAKSFSDAAIIHLEYLDGLHTAARLLCKAYAFNQAIRLVAKHKQPGLLNSVVDPGLVEASAMVTEMLAEMKTQLQNQVPRLRELRQKRTENPMAFLNGDVADKGDADIPDDISIAPTDASTTGTFMTRYTNNSMGTLATNATRKTSKNRRREERKRARGKKGTVYEEEYLVNSIARLIERLNDTSEDVTKLVEGLMRRSMRERAVAVEVAMMEVTDACKAIMGEVFASPAAAQASGGDGVNGNETAQASRPWGGQGVLWDAMNATEARTPAPVLKAFERLPLLS
ncbi:IkappaB kinase complex, IKAP component [Teratosphaeria nubilosa]|uniref:Elongator complex protein 1 n=1 Tax=Teratosphaeria nubilosa TaxID=161662 RepID=A0A6G1KZJ6_9PEZI|nr:IkappaB kinase complex, IKAP component [Teratosphaeria nubilosa]